MVLDYVDYQGIIIVHHFGTLRHDTRTPKSNETWRHLRDVFMYLDFGQESNFLCSQFTVLLYFHCLIHHKDYSSGYA